MERYKCRLCFKSFINGRALGGHMRSHMLTLSSKRDLYEPTLEEQEEEMERPSQLSDDVTESDASASSSSSDEFDNNNQKRNRLDEDEESETINLTRKRSKRTRKLGSFDFDVKTSRLGESVVTEPEHHSSASDTTTEEDLAFCLIMLSRDKWKKSVEEDQECEKDYNKSSKNRGRFKCETCGKVFKSYQALGGHRASHKKNKNYNVKTEQVKTEYVKEKRVHQCPICFRVFSSGQALGGHKRSHGSSNGTGGGGGLFVNQIDKEEEVLVKQRMIDLNLPAPNEEDDEIETSLVFDEW